MDLNEKISSEKTPIDCSQLENKTIKEIKEEILNAKSKESLKEGLYYVAYYSQKTPEEYEEILNLVISSFKANDEIIKQILDDYINQFYFDLSIRKLSDEAYHEAKARVTQKILSTPYVTEEELINILYDYLPNEQILKKIIDYSKKLGIEETIKEEIKEMLMIDLNRLNHAFNEEKEKIKQSLLKEAKSILTCSDLTADEYLLALILNIPNLSQYTLNKIAQIPNLSLELLEMTIDKIISQRLSFIKREVITSNPNITDQLLEKIIIYDYQEIEKNLKLLDHFLVFEALLYTVDKVKDENKEKILTAIINHPKVTTEILEEVRMLCREYKLELLQSQAFYRKIEKRYKNIMNDLSDNEQENTYMFWDLPTLEKELPRAYFIDRDHTVLRLKNIVTPEDLIGKENEYPPKWYIELCEKSQKSPYSMYVLLIDETEANDNIKSIAWNIIEERRVNEKWLLPENTLILVMLDPKDIARPKLNSDSNAISPKRNNENESINYTTLKKCIGNTLAPIFVAYYQMPKLNIERIKKGLYTRDDFPTMDDRLYALSCVLSSNITNELVVLDFIEDCLGEDYISIYLTIKEGRETALTQPIFNRSNELKLKK